MGASERERGGKGWGGRDRKGGVIINLATTGGNTRREWGDVRQTTNGIRLRILMSKSGVGMSEMERLSVDYRERIEAQKVANRVKAQRRRAASDEEARDR